jgi:hypothetical protein
MIVTKNAAASPATKPSSYAASMVPVKVAATDPAAAPAMVDAAGSAIQTS